MTSEADYLSALTSIMTGKHTKVVIKGNGACINKDGRTNFVILPEDGALDAYPLTNMLTDDEIKELNKHLDITRLTPEMLAKARSSTTEVARQFMRRMLAYHESAHGRYSPDSKLMNGTSQEVRTLYNLFEDHRVEANFSADFPPMYDKFYKLRRTILESTIANIKDLDPQALPDSVKLYLFALAADMISTDFEVSEEYLDNPVVKAILDGIEQVETELDDQRLPLTLADKIVKMMKLKETPAPSKGGVCARNKSGDSMSSKGDSSKQSGGGCDKGQSDERDADAQEGDDDQGQNEQESEEAMPEAEGDDGITEDDLKNIEREYKNLGVSKSPGRDSSVNIKTASLIDQVAAQQVAQVLKNIRGSRRSAREVNSSDGYMLDVEEIMQMRANTNPDGFRPFIDSDKCNPEYDIVLCIDHSGSMASSKMENAKKAAATFCAACQRVKIGTCVIAFDSDVSMVKPFDQMVEHSPLGNLIAEGGTDIALALHDAIGALEVRRRQSDAPKRQAIVLVSDGDDWNTIGIADQIAKAMANNVMSFFIGIGSEPRNLINELAKYCRFDQAVFIDHDGAELGVELRRLAEAFLRTSR